MPKQQTRTDASESHAALAYNFWLARCFRDGSPEEDLFRAVCANSMKSGVKPEVTFSTALFEARRVCELIEMPHGGEQIPR